MQAQLNDPRYMATYRITTVTLPHVMAYIDHRDKPDGEVISLFPVVNTVVMEGYRALEAHYPFYLGVRAVYIATLSVNKGDVEWKKSSEVVEGDVVYGAMNEYCDWYTTLFRLPKDALDKLLATSPRTPRQCIITHCPNPYKHGIVVCYKADGKWFYKFEDNLVVGKGDTLEEAYHSWRGKVAGLFVNTNFYIRKTLRRMHLEWFICGRTWSMYWLE